MTNEEAQTAQFKIHPCFNCDETDCYGCRFTEYRGRPYKGELKGKWIPHNFHKGYSMDRDTCSICGRRFYQLAETGMHWYFCPNCGAIMEE